MPSPPARSSRRSLLPKRAAAIACHRPCALPTCAYEKGPLLTVSASRSARGRQFHTFEPRWGLTPRIPLPAEVIAVVVGRTHELLIKLVVVLEMTLAAAEDRKSVG